MPRYDTITFLTDYGTTDEFVGVVKSVIRQIAPHANVVDLCHDVAPYDVRAGGLEVRRASVSIAGSGNVETRATESANVDIMGSGDVVVTGGAKCSVSKMGSGDVRCG